LTTLSDAPRGFRSPESTAARTPAADQPVEQVEVSIVMPCLNEEEAVALCVEKAKGWLGRAGLSGEVVVVDNGSEDASVERALGAGARVVYEDRRGYGSALRRGIASARGRHIVMGDCDDTYDYRDLEPFIAALKEGADIVVGNRYAGGIMPGAMTWSHRYLGTPVLSFLIRLFSRARVGDSQCGLRAFSRTAYDRLDLQSDGMEFASEMILKAARLGLNIAEVPIQYFPRIGDAKLETFRDGWRHLRFLLLATPDTLYTLPGMLLGLAGLAVLALGLGSADGSIDVGPVEWRPIFAGSMLVILGLNALFFACVAHLYTASAGITPGGGLAYRLAKSLFRFERVLLGTAVLLGLGLGLNLFLALAEEGASNRASYAALAQTLILSGGNFALSGFLGSVMHNFKRA